MDNPHQFEVRVYFEDTDFSGNVYHAAYLKFMERARTEYLRAIDIHHHKLFDEGVVFAVRHMDISYDAPAQIDDVLGVCTVLAGMGGARFVLEQKVVRGEEVLVRARVTAVVMNLAGRPVRLPKAMRERMRAAAAEKS